MYDFSELKIKIAARYCSMPNQHGSTTAIQSYENCKSWRISSKSILERATSSVTATAAVSFATTATVAALRSGTSLADFQRPAF